MNLISAETVVRLSAWRADGTMVYVDHVLDPDYSYNQVWKAAHKSPFGPEPLTLGTTLWSEATRLLASEKRLREMQGAP